MKISPFVLSILAGAVLFSLDPAKAHDRYPQECCHGKDCAPVEDMAWIVPLGASAPQLVVTSKHGTVIIPLAFLCGHRMTVACMSVCIGPLTDGMVVACFFNPPRT